MVSSDHAEYTQEIQLMEEKVSATKTRKIVRPKIKFVLGRTEAVNPVVYAVS